MQINDEVIGKGLDQVIEIARRRAAVIENLKEAIRKNDIENIRHYASCICGLRNESN